LLHAKVWHAAIDKTCIKMYEKFLKFSDETKIHEKLQKNIYTRMFFTDDVQFHGNVTAMKS